MGAEASIATDLIGKRCVVVRFLDDKIVDRGVIRAISYTVGGEFAFLIALDPESPNVFLMGRPNTRGFRPMMQVSLHDEGVQVQIED